MQSAETVGVGVRFVAGVDDRSTQVVALDTLPDVFGALTEAVHRAARRLSTFPAPQISCRETRNGMRESASWENSAPAGDQVFSVTAVGVPAESVLFLKR